MAAVTRPGVRPAEPWSSPRVRTSAGRSRAPVSVAVAPGVRRAALAFERAAVGPPVRLPVSIYRRRRAVAAGLVVALVLAAWVALGMLGGGPLAVPERPNPSSSPLAGGTVYVVQPGDTFWSIVNRLRPDADPRPLVDRLVKDHRGPTLYVGERLPLPGP